MIIHGKIRDEKLQQNISIEATKTSALLSGKIGKYEHFGGKEIIPPEQSRNIGQIKFNYSPLEEVF